MTANKKLEHRIEMRALDFILEAAQRGEDLNERVALARAASEINRERMVRRAQREAGKKVRLF